MEFGLEIILKQDEELKKLQIDHVQEPTASDPERIFYIKSPQTIKDSKDISPLAKKIENFYIEKGFRITYSTFLPDYGSFCATNEEEFYQVWYSFNKGKSKKETIRLKEHSIPLDPVYRNC